MGYLEKGRHETSFNSLWLLIFIGCRSIFLEYVKSMDIILKVLSRVICYPFHCWNPLSGIWEAISFSSQDFELLCSIFHWWVVLGSLLLKSNVRFYSVSDYLFEKLPLFYDGDVRIQLKLHPSLFFQMRRQISSLMIMFLYYLVVMIREDSTNFAPL